MPRTMLNVYEELGETSRRQILSELRSGPKNVGDLVEATGLKQPNVSNHLSRMRSKGIVRANKTGRQVFYQLATPEVEAIVNAVFAVRTSDASNIQFEELTKKFAKAAVDGEEALCGDILDEAFRAQASLLDIYQEILAPAMAMVGSWYAVHAIDEGQEHMASSITERMMARTAQITGPARRNGRTAVIGCPPNGYHVIGIRMISDYLRFSGWRTLFLGSNVPIKSFVSIVEQNHPDIVLVSCCSEESEPDFLALLTRLAAMRSKRLGYFIGAGGSRVNLHPDKFIDAGADFTAKDLRTFATECLPSLNFKGKGVEPEQSMTG